MLTLYHAPLSRSGVIVALIHEMGIEDKINIQPVEVISNNGAGEGRADPNNPHPEKKVPVLDHDGVIITERAAIMAHLANLFPNRAAPEMGTPLGGKYLSWLIWYQDVMETVYFLEMIDVAHPAIAGNFRGTKEAAARLIAALETGPWLMGETFTGADLIAAPMFQFAPNLMPDDSKIQDWYARVMARPSMIFAKEYDESLLAAV